MWNNDQLGRLWIYPLHHGIFTNFNWSSLAWCQGKSTTNHRASEKGEWKNDLLQQNYLQFYHKSSHLMQKQTTYDSQALPANLLIAFQKPRLSSRSNLLPQTYYREPEYTNLNNTKTTNLMRLMMLLAVQPTDLNGINNASSPTHVPPVIASTFHCIIKLQTTHSSP